MAQKEISLEHNIAMKGWLKCIQIRQRREEKRKYGEGYSGANEVYVVKFANICNYLSDKCSKVKTTIVLYMTT